MNNLLGQWISNLAGMQATTTTGGLLGAQQAQWTIPYQQFPTASAYPIPTEPLLEVLLKSRLTGDTQHLISLISYLHSERSRLQLENDALKAELDRVKNFKEWFADGKEPHEPK